MLMSNIDIISYFDISLRRRTEVMLMLSMKCMRERAGLTRRDVIPRVNKSIMTMSRWERGIALPSYDYLKKLASLYSCSVDELVEERSCADRRCSQCPYAKKMSP